MNIQISAKFERPLAVGDHVLGLESIHQQRLDQLTRWMARDLVRDSSNAETLALLFRVNHYIKVVLATPPNRVKEMTLCATYVAATKADTSGYELLFVCSAQKFVNGLQSVLRARGPYFVQITNDSLAVFSRGREGFALPRTPFSTK